jgi:hypothetical protein
MIVKNEKKTKYDVLTKKLGAIHNCKTRIILYILMWNGIVTKFHKTYTKEIGVFYLCQGRANLKKEI